MAPVFFHDGGPDVPTGFLCQWYKCKFTAKGHEFNCAEQWMMWQKAVIFGDEATGKAILAEKNPRKQKRLGKDVVGFDDKIWNQHRLEVVIEGDFHKFRQAKTSVMDTNNKPMYEPQPLKDLLFETGDRELVEASPFDKIWGIGFSAQEAATHGHRQRWGLNLLGKAPMEVRARLRKELEENANEEVRDEKQGDAPQEASRGETELNHS